MRYRAAVATLAAIALSSGPAVRAQAPQPAPRPTPGTRIEIIPPISTELVQVDVVVTDKQGRPVTGLTADDFTVLEDGRPQRISHFMVTAHAMAAAAPTAAAPATAPAEKPAAAEEAPSGRFIVLAVDDLHMSASSLANAKAALKRFVDRQINDEDDVAVVATSGAAGLFQPFTKDRWALHHAIDRLTLRERRAARAGRSSLTEFEAEAIERGDEQAFQLAVQEVMLADANAISGRAGEVSNPRVESEVRASARAVLSEALDVSTRTLGMVESVVRGLAPVSGRKMVVLVSDGFLVGAGARDSQAYDLRRLIDASARAGVAVYSLDSKGLAASVPGGDAASPAQLVITAPGARERLDRLGQIAIRESLGALAEGTGGLFVHGTNDLGLGLDKILRDSDAVYLIAYEPTSTDRDGRFHEIQVKLPRHRELRVRARRGYFAPDDRQAAVKGAPPSPATEAARRERDIRTALASLFPLRGVPVRLSADWVDVPPAGSQLVIRAHVDMAGIRFERVDDRYRADVEVVGVVYDENGTVVGDIEGQQAGMNLVSSNYEQVLKEGLRYQRTLALKPGRYQVRVVAREATSSQLGSAFTWVDVPDPSSGGLALSSVFLYTEAAGRRPDPAAGTAGLEDIQALRRLTPGKPLYYVVYVYNPARGESGETDVVLQAQIWAGEKLQGVSPVQVVPFGDASAPPLPMTGRIALDGLAPGDYELRVLASDRKADANTLRRISFQIAN